MYLVRLQQLQREREELEQQKERLKAQQEELRKSMGQVGEGGGVRGCGEAEGRGGSGEMCCVVRRSEWREGLADISEYITLWLLARLLRGKKTCSALCIASK